MKWNKRGLVYCLSDSQDRSNHMQAPKAVINGDIIRIYYSGRKDGMSFPAFIDIDRRAFKKDSVEILRVQDRSIMAPGVPGEFDSDGIMPGSFIPVGDEIWMHYTGWNEKSKTARYHNAIGLAVSVDGGDTFERRFFGPVVDRSKYYPGLSVTPFVMFKNWYRMWYISGVSWNKVGDIYEPVYVIRYADSVNGIDWNQRRGQCIVSANDMEAFSNPSVICRDNIYHMWFCFRGSEDYRDGSGAYRIGYGTSTNAIDFRRDSKKTLDMGKAGEFDSLMQCYPNVVEIDGRLVMFYNGNSFGQTGIGYAVAD